jgi:carbon-monoxide dehydrogenase medium subunit
MRPAPFEYIRPTTVAEAVRAVHEAGEDARVLAGGQVLVNLMRSRRLRPSLVVDISRIAELDYVRLDAQHLAVGSLTRLRELAADDVRAACRALAEAARAVGDPQVRNSATAGGNILNPDPVSDLAPVLLASDGAVVVEAPEGRREIAAADFLAAPSGTPIGPLVIMELRFGRPAAASAFEKLSRRAADAAMASAAAFVELEDGCLSEVGLALGAVHERPLRATAVEDELRGRPFDPDTARQAVRELCATLDPPDTVHASAGYRRAVAPVVAVRALQRAVDEATRS